MVSTGDLPEAVGKGMSGDGAGGDDITHGQV